MEAKTWAESTLQEHVRKMFVLLGWSYYHTWNALHSPEGYPDVTAAKDGRIIWAELKQQGADPTPRQMGWLAVLALNPRVEVYLWRPYDWLSGEIQAIMEDPVYVSTTRVNPHTIFQGKGNG
jgi:hypothetical protein